MLCIVTGALKINVGAVDLLTDFVGVFIMDDCMFKIRFILMVLIGAFNRSFYFSKLPLSYFCHESLPHIVH